MMGSGDESDLNVVSEHDSDFTNSPRRDLAWKFGDVFKKREDFCESPNFLFSALHISQCIHCCPLSRCNEFFVLAVNVDKTEYSPQKRRKLSTSLLSNVFNYDLGMMKDKSNTRVAHPSFYYSLSLNHLIHFKFSKLIGTDELWQFFVFVVLRCSLCEKLLSSFDCLLGVVIDGFFGRDSFEVAVIGLWSFRKTARRLVFFYQLVSRLFCKETVRRLGMVTNMYPSSALIGQDMDVTLDRDELMGLLEFPVGD
uniref:Uncharacterized protein n=1 Tax=Daucus carota subsp. sativus TaxID=79200 RepID=A0A164UCB6_DAUCS